MTRIELGIWWGWSYTTAGMPAHLRITHRELLLMVEALRRHVEEMRNEQTAASKLLGDQQIKDALEKKLCVRLSLLDKLSSASGGERLPTEVVDDVRFVETKERGYEVDSIALSLRLLGIDLCAYAKASAVLGRPDLEEQMSAAIDVARLISRLTNQPTNPRLWPQFVTTGEFSRDPKIFQHPWR